MTTSKAMLTMLPIIKDLEEADALEQQAKALMEDLTECDDEFDNLLKTPKKGDFDALMASPQRDSNVSKHKATDELPTTPPRKKQVSEKAPEKLGRLQKREEEKTKINTSRFLDVSVKCFIRFSWSC